MARSLSIYFSIYFPKRSPAPLIQPFLHHLAAPHICLDIKFLAQDQLLKFFLQHHPPPPVNTSQWTPRIQIHPLSLFPSAVALFPLPPWLKPISGKHRERNCENSMSVSPLTVISGTPIATRAPRPVGTLSPSHASHAYHPLHPLLQLGRRNSSSRASVWPLRWPLRSKGCS